MIEFKFTEEQLDEAHVIIEEIVDKCRGLQEETGCPNSEIKKMIASAKSFWENKSPTKHQNSSKVFS